MAVISAHPGVHWSVVVANLNLNFHPSSNQFSSAEMQSFWKVLFGHFSPLFCVRERVVSTEMGNNARTMSSVTFFLLPIASFDLPTLDAA